MRTGTVHIANTESRLDGILLALCGDPDPFGAATVFLESKGIGNGDRITVAGADGKIGNVKVICMTAAAPAALAAGK
jgi:hypothetical protein